MDIYFKQLAMQPIQSFTSIQQQGTPAYTQSNCILSLFNSRQAKVREDREDIYRGCPVLRQGWIHHNCIINMTERHLMFLDHNRNRPFVRRHTAPLFYPFEGESNIELVQFRTTTATDIWRDINHQMHNERLMLLQDYYPEILSTCEGAEESSVCAKIIRKGDTIAECFDCRFDSSCVICKECYQNGNHEGHKVVFKKAHGGCCDCGDSQAWKPEGFCKNHNGELKDVEINPEDNLKFSDIMQDMFYIFYRLKQTGIQKTKVFHQSLIRMMNSIIQRGIKGIKMLTMFFQTRFHETHKINSQLDNSIFLHNLIHYKLMERYMKDWENIFISMFPYYPFKQQLLVAYVHCFPQVYLGDQDGNTGQSLACQILTSYKLVEDYIKIEGSSPLGYNLHNYLQSAETLGYQCTIDLEKINSLQGGVPLKYWKFQLKHGITNLFLYYQLLRKNYADQCKQKQIQQKPEQNVENVQLNDFERTAFIVTYEGLIQNQHVSLRLLNSTVNIINQDKKLLENLICQLIQLIQLDNTKKDLIIFRPYDRLFTLAFYTYIDKDLNYLESQQNKVKIIEMLGLTANQWQDLLFMIFKRIFTSFTFFSHILINEKKGYNSSFYDYLNVYHINDHLMSNIDILLLKIVFLCSSDPSRLSLFFEEAVRLKELEQTSWNLNNFTIFMQEIGLLYTGKTAEIYINYENTQPNPIYKDDILIYLRKYMTFKREAVGFDQVNSFCECFLFDNKDALRKNLKQICVYDKQKKTFKIKEEFKDNDPFNFKDYELRTREKNTSSASEHPKNTLQFINGYNKSIFLNIWNRANLEKLKKIIKDLYRDLNETKIKQSLVEFIACVCKFVCLLIHCDADDSDIEIFKDLLKNMDINSEIRIELSLYSDILSEISIDLGNENLLTNNKKEQMQLKKMRKMEQLKKKQSSNMNLASQMHQSELEKIKNEKNSDVDNCNYCVICRIKEQQNQLVYLTNLTLRDLEKLSKLGIGQVTASFSTCYHVFHLDCMNKSKAVRANLQTVYKCPLCRKIGNTVIPVGSIINNEAFVNVIKACLYRMRKSMKILKEFTLFSVIEELVISFYHYVLMSQYYFDKVKDKRKKLYKIIIQLLSHPYFSPDIELIQIKIRQDNLTFLPSIQPKRNHYRMRAIYEMNVEEIDLQDFVGDLDQDDEDFEEQFIYRMEQTNQRIVRENNELQERRIMRRDERLERAINNQLKRPLKKRNARKTSEQTTNILKYTLERVIEVILKKQVQAEEKMPKKQKNDEERQAAAIYVGGEKFSLSESEKLSSNGQQDKYELPEVSPLIIAIVDDLLDVANPTPFTSIPFELIKLPTQFNWDLTKNFCHQCKCVSTDAMKCLLCDWLGCLQCIEGGTSKHASTAHGLVAPFMRMNDTMAIVINKNESRRMGFLYANEWGDGFKINKNWQDYTFQEEIYQKIKINLICEQ